MRKHEEVERKIEEDITIDYQANTDSLPDVVANTMAEFVHTGVSGNNYIIYN